MKKRVNSIAVLHRKTYLFDEGKNSFMRNRVKSFLEINQHNVVEFFAVHSRVKLLIEELYVTVNRHPGTETMLIRGKDRVNRGSDTFSDAGGNNSVICVVDHQGSGVFCKVGRFLLEHVQQTCIEVVRRGMTFHEPVNAGEKNRCRDISSVSVDFKRDIIRANCRVIGVVNDSVDKVLSDSSGGTRNTLVVYLKKFGSILGRGVMPFITPKLRQNLIDFDGIIGDSVITIFDGGNSFLGGGKRATNSGELVSCGFGGGIVSVGGKFSVDKVK